MKVIHGLPLLGILHSVILNGACGLIRLTFLVPGLLLIIGMLMILLWKCLILLMSGRMVAGKTSPLDGFEVAGAGVYLPASELAFEGSVWGVAEEVW